MHPGARLRLRRIVGALLLATAACPAASDRTSPGASSAAASAKPNPAAMTSSSAASVQKPPPDDLDVEPLRRALKCGGGATRGPCGVLSAFASCARWDDALPSGEGRWIGRSYTVEGSKTKEQVHVMRVRSGNVGSGELPFQVGFNAIAHTDEKFAQIERAIRALERHDVPPKSNSTIDDLKKRTDWTEASGTQTKGGQLYLVTRAGSYVCRTPQQNVFVVQRAASHESDPDGIYAELWPVTW